MLASHPGSPTYTPEGSPDYIGTSPKYTPTCPSYEPNSPCAKADHPDFARGSISSSYSPTAPPYSSCFPTSRAAEDPMLINGVEGSTPHHSPCATQEEVLHEIPDFSPLPSPAHKAPTTQTPMKRLNSSMLLETPIKKTRGNHSKKSKLPPMVAPKPRPPPKNGAAKTKKN